MKIFLFLFSHLEPDFFLWSHHEIPKVKLALKEIWPEQLIPGSSLLKEWILFTWSTLGVTKRSMEVFTWHDEQELACLWAVQIALSCQFSLPSATKPDKWLPAIWCSLHFSCSLSHQRPGILYWAPLFWLQKSEECYVHANSVVWRVGYNIQCAQIMELECLQQGFQLQQGINYPDWLLWRKCTSMSSIIRYARHLHRAGPSWWHCQPTYQNSLSVRDSNSILCPTYCIILIVALGFW